MSLSVLNYGIEIYAKKGKEKLKLQRKCFDQNIPFWTFPGLPANTGDAVSIPGPGRLHMLQGS